MFVPLPPHCYKKGERTNSVMNFRRGGGLQENDQENRPLDQMVAKGIQELTES